MNTIESLERRVMLAADMVLEWNKNAILTLKADSTLPGPGWASRSLAMVHAAVFDAVNGIDRSYRPYLVHIPAPRFTNMDAAIASAAHRVLAELYPAQRAALDAKLADSLDDVPNGPGEAIGVLYGRAVANFMLFNRADDGSDEELEYSVNPEPGHWEPDPMNPTQMPWGPNWGAVQPFALRHGDQFAPPAPPDMTSADYAESFNEVKELGALNSTSRTAEQTQMGLFWAYDRGGKGAPPSLYNEIAQNVAIQQQNTVVENARLFALMNIAQADAGIAAWEAKFREDFWRPITGIRRAAEDGNPLTNADPNWVPLGAPGGGTEPDFTPPFPAYVSGHATFGAAAFHVLREFYGTDDITFTATSEELPGVTRTFTSFSEAAAENGRSRIYLGIHWDFDDEQGQALGRDIADWVVDRVARPRRHIVPAQQPDVSSVFSERPVMASRILDALEPAADDADDPATLA